MKTLGGRQFWGDVAFFRGWRIQHNVITGHYRLLDPHDWRQAWGSLDRCRTRLNEIREERSLTPMSGEAVILLHGIIRSSKSMSRMAARLTEDGFLCVPLDYPSTRVNLDRSAGYLQQVIESLEGVERISFVAMSLGGLVVRAWLRQHHDPRCRTLVMLGTPNQGAEMAALLTRSRLVRLIMGPAGRQLSSSGECVPRQLPVPDFPFGIIAGARSSRPGWNPLLPGDDDGTVTVESTRLPGAADFLTVPCLHTFLPQNAQVIEATSRFLAEGRFPH